MSNPTGQDVVVFIEALKLPEGHRAAYLDQACLNDADLRRKLEALLEAHKEAGDFLEDFSQTNSPLSEREGLFSEKPGDRIGQFKLLEKIGEGGCGVVFMAEQEQPVRRRVALKIIKPGMDSKSVIARFEAERQALALMDHPNIAKIFNAGSTESGRPYFVMELVRGIKITEYCDQHTLSTEERLKLFVQVCHAIQHAHQKGIIHRDIKPSNILVTTTLENKPLPVVIDFGIAKATTNQRLTDKTLFTSFEMLIGTPAYMSPEQAELTSADVDTRTDIYSLGILLYELLTGSTPFDAGELLKSGLDEIRRVIREQEPVRPSTRLSKLTGAQLTVLALHRKSEPPTLIRAVRGDLDWIVMKALEKERKRRYATANGLAVEVQRYLAGEPISARPPSTLYKIQKTVLRNQLLFTGIGIITILLIGSLVIVSGSLAKERKARSLADAALKQAQIDKSNAQTASVKSQQVTKFLENMLQGVGPSVARGRDTAMLREILDQTAIRVGKEMTNQPELEAELRSLIGRLYFDLGNYSQSETMQRTALAFTRKQYGADSKATSVVLGELGMALFKEGNLQEAEAVHREALAIRRRLFGNVNSDVASSLNELARVLRHQRRLAESEMLARESLKIRQTLFGAESLEVADSLHNLSIVLGDEGRSAEAESTATEILRMRRKLVGTNDLAVASAINDLAWAKGLNGNFAGAARLQAEALEMQRKLLGEENPEVAKTLSSLGERVRQAGNLKDSEIYLREALSIQGKMSGENSPDYLYTLDSLGSTLDAEQKWTEAEGVERKALDSWRKLNGNQDPRTLDALDRFGMTLESEGKWSASEAVRRESLAGWRNSAGEGDPHTLHALIKFGLSLERGGKYAEAERVLGEALDLWRKQAGTNNPEALYAIRDLGLALEGQGKWPEAESAWRESLPAWRKLAGDEDPQTLYTLRKLGLALEALNKWPEAEMVHREALASARKLSGNEGAEAVADLEKLARVLIAQTKFAEAEKLLSEVLIPTFVIRPASANLLVQRVNLWGRTGRWMEAAADATLVLEYQPADHYRYHTLAGLLAMTHNRTAYEELCRKLLARFADTTNPYIAERTADDFLLLPDSGISLEVIDKLADHAVSLGGGSESLPFFQACKAMSCYRLGHFSEAIEWAKKAINSPQPYAQAKACAIASMANWQLGNKDLARQLLLKGDALAPIPTGAAGSADIGQSWVAWLFGRVQLDEAAALIQPVLVNSSP